MSGEKFKYVYIPAEVSEPLQELELDQPAGKEVECLLDALKAHFRRKHGGKTAEQLTAQKQELLKNLPPGTDLQDKLLNVATDLCMVENIALLNNAKDVGFVGVNMYVDDEGAIKDAAFNRRASDIAACCGKPLQVRGDAFLARIFDNEDEFKRLDLLMSEVSSSADWVREAKRRNDAAQSSRSRGSDFAEELKRKAGSTAKIRELSLAEAAKDSGNAAFKAGDFSKAVEFFNEALSHDSSMTSAQNNRAMAHLKLGNFRLAEQDCEQVLSKEPENVKALMRRASARKGQGNDELAVQDLQRVLELEPVNKQARLELDTLAAG